MRPTDKNTTLGLLITPMNAEEDRNLEYYIQFDSVLRGTLGNFRLDSIDDPRLCERAEITKLITLTSNDLAHDTAHDLNKLLNRCLIARMK